MNRSHRFKLINQEVHSKTDHKIKNMCLCTEDTEGATAENPRGQNNDNEGPRPPPMPADSTNMAPHLESIDSEQLQEQAPTTKCKRKRKRNRTAPKNKAAAEPSEETTDCHKTGQEEDAKIKTNVQSSNQTVEESNGVGSAMAIKDPPSGAPENLSPDRLPSNNQCNKPSDRLMINQEMKYLGEKLTLEMKNLGEKLTLEMKNLEEKLTLEMKNLEEKTILEMKELGEKTILEMKELGEKTILEMKELGEKHVKNQ